MRIPKPVLAICCLLMLGACKDKEKPGIEERNEVPEISNLTTNEELEKHLTSNINATDDVELINTEQVLEFYKKNHYQPLWNERKLREDLFRNIEIIGEEGLFFQDYHGSYLKEKLASLDKNSITTNTSLEIMLTDAFLELLEDLGTGKLNPTNIYEIWGTPLNEINSEALLKKAISEKRIPEILDSIRPHHPVYTGLKKSLKEIRKEGLEEESIASIAEGKLIRPGETDSRIIEVSKRLKELDYAKNIPNSNNYSKEIENSVKEFQKDHGLEIDGLLGNSTIRNLNMTKKDRYHQLLVNLERWRWYPRNLGDLYIIINIADFKLYVVKSGDTIRTHKIMVGTQARQTPVFSEKIGYIVYNPTWTIPPTIKKNDVIPGAKNDSAYLHRKNLKIYDDSGRTLDPKEVDWSSSSARSYVYRQAAGPSNPLGLVKIIYPNKYMIYLHDTPSKSLFNKNTRAQSSGCVRVENVLELAEFLLDNQDTYDHDKIEEILKSGKTTEIPVTKNVQVHHFYWTAYYQNNTIHFIDDVYNFDEKLWGKLKPNPSRN